jgi:hypothetical protein
MKQSATKPEPKANRAALVAGFFMLLLAGFFAWYLIALGGQHSTSKSSTNHQASSSQLASKQAEDGQIKETTSVPKKRDRQKSKFEKTSAPATFSEIDRVLTNDRVSDDEAAIEMAKIALDMTRPEAERLEAMEHGKNLGFSHLLPISSDPNLPVPLAKSYLHGLHGHAQVKEQVSGALGLLSHNDSEIRQEAGILLGFLLEAEEDNESSDKLREKADAFLKQPDEGDGEK